MGLDRQDIDTLISEMKQVFSTKEDIQNLKDDIQKLREDSETSFTGLARMFEERETRFMGKMDDVLTQSSETYQEQLFSGNQTRENKKELEELDRRVKVLEGQQSLI